VAIVVLVLWMFTAGAGFYLLVTSNLGRARPAVPESATAGASAATGAAAAESAAAGASAATGAAAAGAAAAESAAARTPAAGAAAAESAAARTPAAAQPASVMQTTTAAQATPRPAAAQASQRQMRRAARDRWDPPSLTAAKNAPIVPGARSLLEFAHPACAIIGLAFWLGFTLVHNRTLGWLAFGLIAVTACLGLTWVLANVRAARRGAADKSAPRFAGRLMILHGSAAAVTIALAALSAVVTRG
jgi:hypothetical protein